MLSFSACGSFIWRHYWINIFNLILNKFQYLFEPTVTRCNCVRRNTFQRSIVRHTSQNRKVLSVLYQRILMSYCWNILRSRGWWMSRLTIYPNFPKIQTNILPKTRGRSWSRCDHLNYKMAPEFKKWSLGNKISPNWKFTPILVMHKCVVIPVNNVSLK